MRTNVTSDLHNSHEVRSPSVKGTGLRPTHYDEL